MRLDLCAEICTLIPVAGSHGRALSRTFFFPPRWIQTGGEKVGLDAGRKHLGNQNYSKQCQKDLQTHKEVGFQVALRWVL